jgi:hypothetical protein
MAEQQGRKSSMKSSMKGGSTSKKQGGSGGGLDLSGLTDSLGGLVGGLGKTVSGVTGELTNTLNSVLGNLLGPLLQLKEQAQGGSEEARQAYGQAVDMIKKSSQQGRQDADALLKELGEELDTPPEEETEH